MKTKYEIFLQRNTKFFFRKFCFSCILVDLAKTV